VLTPIGPITSRMRMARVCAAEWISGGLPVLQGDPSNGVVFLLDGVGGFLLAPSTARRALRQYGLGLATYLYDWHRGPRGEMIADLVCRGYNQRQALRLARIIRQFRREHPRAPIHVYAYSAGTGIATFALEKLGNVRIQTAVLAASAMSPDYDFTDALRHCERCIAFCSRRDWLWIGLGTSVFGTVDRRFGAAGGYRGFAQVDRPRQPGCGEFVQLNWEPRHRRLDHYGHHTGFATVPFVREEIVPLLTNPGSKAGVEAGAAGAADSPAAAPLAGEAGMTVS
jgi:pimeloyl-ACP methyl ester carboxylesterase